MAILATSGRTVIAMAIKNLDIHFAWGTGLESWDDELPRENSYAPQLTNEIGRRKATIVQYCTPSPDGEIVTLGGRFKASATPTNSLHINAVFDFDDGLGSTIRELATFVGTELASNLPAGQRYFKPNDVVNRGRLLTLDHISNIQRGVGASNSFHVVVTF